MAVMVATACIWGQTSAVKSGGKKVPAAPAKKALTYWSTDEGKWEDSASMPGLHQMVVSGDPEKGASVIYLKLDPSTTIGWHWHPGPEIVYGDAGTAQLETFKGEQKVKVTSGSYARLAGHTIHKASCISKEPCTLYLESPVPLITHMVDAKGKTIPDKKKS